MCDLSGQSALITGSTRGVGRCIALKLAQVGCRVVVTGRKLEDVSTTAQELNLRGHQAVAVQLDVADMESVRRCVEESIKHCGQIDILVNNAGVFPRQLGLAVRDDEFGRCLDVNLIGVWRMVQALVPHFKTQEGGKIINIASVAGRRGRAHEATYGASKAAVINLTQGLADDLGPHRITVNAICPGGITTDLTVSTASLLRDSTYEHLLHQKDPCPLAGEPLTTEDIAHAVVFFSSKYARCITGQALNIDRGFCMN